jgi:hypothetical protein
MAQKRTPEQKERLKETNKIWRLANKDKVNEKNRQWMAEHKAYGALRSKERRLKFKEEFENSTRLRAESLVCVTCNKLKLASYYDKSNSSNSGLHSKCRECSNIRTTENYRIKNYKVTPAMFEEMFSKQGGKCEICGIHQADCVKSFHVDHDHATGVVRGLLCGRCNLLLGNVNDNQETLQSAINYLRKYKEL